MLQQALEWEHLVNYLILAQQRVEGRCIQAQQGQEWAYLLTLARVGWSMVVTQNHAESTLAAVVRRERRYRRRMMQYILTEMQEASWRFITRQRRIWVELMHFWHSQSLEFIQRKGVGCQARQGYALFFVLRCESKY